MQNTVTVSPLKACINGGVLAAASFAPASTPTINEAWGCTVSRLGAGSYRITLADKVPGFVAFVSHTENDTTTFHFVRVESTNVSAGTADISHKSVAFASVADGPTASDTVDGIQVLIFARGQ